MINEISYNICKRLTENYNTYVSDNVSLGEVLGKFESLVNDEKLNEQYHDTLEKLYYNRLSKAKSIMFVNVLRSMNENFQNPFYTGEDVYDENNVIDHTELVIDKKALSPESDYPIMKVGIWDSNVNGKIMCNPGGKEGMYSGAHFIEGDTIEECPIREINKLSMYSEDVRDISFELEPGSDRYGIPQGYANVYRTTDGDDGNIDYEYIPKTHKIRFYAIKRIKPNEELVLRVQYQ